jgi:hypothetical protein
MNLPVSLTIRGRHAADDRGRAARVCRAGPAGEVVLDPTGVVKGWAVERAADHLGVSAESARDLIGRRVSAVLPRAFGVMAIDARDPLALTNPLRARKMVVHLLPAGTPLPADSGPYPFGSAVNNQRMVEIEVWEQRGPEASEEPAENVRIGSGRLRDLPPRPAGTPFEVSFLVSETGQLTVDGHEPESGAKIRFDLQIGGLDTAAVDTARASIARHRVSG